MKLYAEFLSMRRRLRREVRLAMRTHGNVRAAAKSLGMPRSTFHDWLTGKAERRRSTEAA
jgi:transcriptional regulator of acetoin/glycerol metabolism